MVTQESGTSTTGVLCACGGWCNAHEQLAARATVRVAAVFVLYIFIHQERSTEKERETTEIGCHVYIAWARIKKQKKKIQNKRKGQKKPITWYNKNILKRENVR